MRSNIEQREREMMQVFGGILSAEHMLAEKQAAIDALKKQAMIIEHEIADIQLKQSTEWNIIASMMQETGEVEFTLAGRGCDYKIGYSTPRESVKVVDDAAVPDDFVKMVRQPMKKEIGEHLKALRDAGEALPNWAALEKGESKLTYKVVKKKVSAA